MHLADADRQAEVADYRVLTNGNVQVFDLQLLHKEESKYSQFSVFGEETGIRFPRAEGQVFFGCISPNQPDFRRFPRNPGPI
jgi:hypothetical protein